MGNLELEPNVSMNWATDAEILAIAPGKNGSLYSCSFWNWVREVCAIILEVHRTAPDGSPTSAIALETRMESVTLFYEDGSFEDTFLCITLLREQAMFTAI